MKQSRPLDSDVPNETMHGGRTDWYPHITARCRHLSSLLGKLIPYFLPYRSTENPGSIYYYFISKLSTGQWPPNSSWASQWWRRRTIRWRSTSATSSASRSCRPSPHHSRSLTCWTTFTPVSTLSLRILTFIRWVWYFLLQFSE